MHGEDVGKVAIVALRPDVATGRRVDQLRRDPHPIAGAPNRSFQHRTHAKLRPDRPDVGALSPIGKARVAGDHHQAGDLGKVGDDVLGDAVREVLLLGIGGEVVERQDRYRGAIGGRFQGGLCAGWPRSGRVAFAQSECADRTGDVLQRLLADILHGDLEFADQFLMHLGGDADAAGFGEAFEPRRNVDAIAEDVRAFADHVAEIDADPQHDPARARR